jgi:hypothetical protein
MLYGILVSKIDWHISDDGSITRRLSQEGSAAAIAEKIGIFSANKSSSMTSFYSGLPVETITPY